MLILRAVPIVSFALLTGTFGFTEAYGEESKLLTAEVKKILADTGFDPLVPKVAVRREAAYQRELRDWLAEHWEVPVRKLATEHGHGDDVFAFWKRAMDYLYLAPSAPELHGLKIEDLLAEGMVLEEKKCDDPLAGYLIAELRRTAIGAGYFPQGEDKMNDLMFKSPYLSEMPSTWHARANIREAIRNEKFGNIKLSPELLAKAANNCVTAVESGEIGPEDDQIYVRFLLLPICGCKWDEGAKHWEAVGKILRDSGPTDWSKAVGEAQWEIRLAWLSRGRTFASGVTPEGWKGFAEHLTLARKAAERAYKVHPDRPEAATAMITITMGGHGSPGLTEWDWFKRATEAEVDYWMAISSILDALEPKWGGSVPELVGVGLAMASAESYDSDISLGLFSAILKISEVTGVDLFQIIRTPGIKEAVMGTAVGLADAPERSWDRKRRLLFVAIYAYGCGEKEIAAKALAETDGKYHPSTRAALTRAGVTWSEIKSVIAIGRWPDAERFVGEAAKAVGERDYATARTSLEKALEIVGENADAKALIDEQLTVCNLESKLAEGTGEWLEIPIQPDLPGWRVLSGDWKYEEPGAITVKGAGLNGWIEHKIRLPKSFSVRGTMRFTSTVARNKRLFCYPGAPWGLPPSRNSDGAAVVIGGRNAHEKPGGQIRTLMDTTARHQTLAGETATKDKVPFVISVRDGKISVEAGGKELFTADPAKFKYGSPHPGGALQFGGIRLYEQNTYTLEDLEIRSGDPAEE